MAGDQFSVVGCRNCSEHWIIEELHRQESASCPRCHTVFAADRLRETASADSFEIAAELRARQLAARAGEAEAYTDEPDSCAAREQAEEYLHWFDDLRPRVLDPSLEIPGLRVHRGECISRICTRGVDYVEKHTIHDRF